MLRFVGGINQPNGSRKATALQHKLSQHSFVSLCYVMRISKLFDYSQACSLAMLHSTSDVVE